MLETLSLAVSAIAMLAAALAIPGLERARLTIVLVALGCGQIYLAILAYGIFMVVESRWRLEPGLSNFAYFWALLLLAGIGLTTTVVPSTSRTYPELAQLGLYVVLALLTMNFLDTGRSLYRFLSAAAAAATAVALMSILTVTLGLQSPPHIFLARGSNEGAVFLSLLGAIPAAALFVRSRNPGYAALLLLFVYVQYLATARGSLIVAGIAGLTAAFFVTRSLIVRVALVLGGAYLLFTSIPMLTSVYESNLNFSARERMTLFDHGVWMWEQRWITGWGWGSTTDLARLAPTELVYPHFHNSYVQLLVEAGVVGWALIGTFIAIVLRAAVVSLVRFKEPALSALVLACGLGLLTAGFFDAMLYGADRAIEVIIILTLITRALKLAEEELFDRTLAVEAAGEAQLLMPREAAELSGR